MSRRFPAPRRRRGVLTLTERDLPRTVVRHTVVPAQRPGLGGRMPVRWQRRYLDAVAGGLPLPAGTSVRRSALGGHPSDTVTVGATVRPRAVLYLHGGAYMVGSPVSHRSLGAFLARASGAAVHLLDYPLAPEHPYPAGLDATVAAYRALLDTGYEPAQVALAGDSAGGALAIAAARRLVDSGVRPAALGLISPAVDIREWELPPDRRAARLDPVVRLRWAAQSRLAYLGAGGDDTDPGVTPVAGRLDGLPPAIVHVDRDELLHARVMEFVKKAGAAGVDVSVHEYRRSWHVMHAHAGLYRPARDAVDEIGEFLRVHLV